MNEKVKILQDLLKERINAGHIERWRKVEVHTFENAPERYHRELICKPGECVIRWNGRKRNGIHDEEFRIFPLAEIDNLITRNKERFKNERPIYR